MDERCCRAPLASANIVVCAVGEPQQQLSLLRVAAPQTTTSLSRLLHQPVNVDHLHASHGTTNVGNVINGRIDVLLACDTYCDALQHRHIITWFVFYLLSKRLESKIAHESTMRMVLYLLKSGKVINRQYSQHSDILVHKYNYVCTFMVHYYAAGYGQ